MHLKPAKKTIKTRYPDGDPGNKSGLSQAAAEWDSKAAERAEAYAGVAGGMDATAADQQPAQEFVAYVPLPEQHEIEARVILPKRLCSSFRAVKCEIGGRLCEIGVHLLLCWLRQQNSNPFGMQ